MFWGDFNKENVLPTTHADQPISRTMGGAVDPGENRDEACALGPH